MPEELSGADVNEFSVQRGQYTTVLQQPDLLIEAFAVNHQPISPAVGYRINYKGRTVVLSGDTTSDEQVKDAARNADLLFHEALSPELVGKLQEAALNNQRSKLAKIFADIPNYHATPTDVAVLAQEAGVGHVVLSHIVPPLPLPPLREVFLGKAPEIFDGPFRIGDDGDGGAAGLALALARGPVRRPGPGVRGAQVAGRLGAGAGLGAPGVQGRFAGLGRGGDPAAAARSHAPGAPAQLRGPGADRAAGAQPQDSLRHLALVAQAVRAAVHARGAALAEFPFSDRAGLAGAPGKAFAGRQVQCIDGRRQGRAGSATLAFRRHHLPEQVVVVMAAGIIAHLGRISRDITENRFQRFRLINVFCLCSIVEIAGICCGMFAVMDFHRHSINHRFQIFICIWQGGLFKTNKC